MNKHYEVEQVPWKEKIKSKKKVTRKKNNLNMLLNFQAVILFSSLNKYK